MCLWQNLLHGGLPFKNILRKWNKNEWNWVWFLFQNLLVQLNIIFPNGRLKAIETLSKFLYCRLGIMKNSRAKVHRQIANNFFPSHPVCENSPCPESRHPHPAKLNPIKNQYQSDHNYYVGRMGSHAQHEQKPHFQTHHRHASLGNSRTLTQPNKMVVVTPTSSPYLKFHTKENKIVESTPRHDQRTANHQFPNHCNKLSMKSVLKDSSGGNLGVCDPGRQSQASTFHQTINVGNRASLEKTFDPETYRMLKQMVQKRVEELKSQIDDQSATISSLQLQIANLNIRLKQKEERLGKMRQETDINKRIARMQNEINVGIKCRLNQQSQLQAQLNAKINSLIESLSVIFSSKNKKFNPTENQWGQVKSFAKIKELMIENRKVLGQFAQIRQSVCTVTRICQAIKGFFMKQDSSRDNLFNQTAEFGQRSGSKASKQKSASGQQKSDLNDSTSYFFHPSELSNMEKFTQIFINRQGQPIRCYTDDLNQVKYKDTHTFMFNKKGDIVKLTQNEKRYYMDKGYIARTH